MTRLGFGRRMLAAIWLASMGTTPALAQLNPPPAPAPVPAPAPAAAETPQAPALVWTTRCTSEGRRLPFDCSMEQRAYITTTGQFIGSVTLRIPPDTQAPVMMVTTPLGLSLASGVVFNIDGGRRPRFRCRLVTTMAAMPARRFRPSCSQRCRAGPRST